MASTADINISERIVERMKALDLSPADVASGCGVSEVSVRNWMKDAHKMRACFLRPLARTLKCSIDYLLGAANRVA